MQRMRMALAGLTLAGVFAAAWLLIGSLVPGTSGGGTHVHSDTIHIGARWRTDDANDLSTLTASSDAVFVGEVSALRSQRVVRLTPPDAPRGAPYSAAKPPADRATSLPISTFDVRVTEVWKGALEAPSIITVEQPGGTIASSPGRTMHLALEGDELMAVGQTYLFWFAPVADGGALTTTPFKRMELTDAGRLQPLAGWGHLGALRRIAALPARDLRRMVAEVDR